MNKRATVIFYINQSESDYHHVNNKKIIDFDLIIN